MKQESRGGDKSLREMTWGLRQVIWGLREVTWGFREVPWGLERCHGAWRGDMGLQGGAMGPGEVTWGFGWSFFAPGRLFQASKAVNIGIQGNHLGALGR